MISLTPVEWGKISRLSLLQIKRRRQGTITLVFSTRDEVHNQAVALKEFLDKKVVSSQ